MKSFDISQTNHHHLSGCNIRTTIAAAVIRSFNRLSDQTVANHSYKATSNSSDDNATIFSRLQKVLPNFNFKFPDNQLCFEQRKKIFDALIDEITNLRTPSIELLKTLHTIEEFLHGSDYLKKVEAVLFESKSNRNLFEENE